MIVSQAKFVYIHWNATCNIKECKCAATAVIASKGAANKKSPCNASECYDKRESLDENLILPTQDG